MTACPRPIPRAAGACNAKLRTLSERRAAELWPDDPVARGTFENEVAFHAEHATDLLRRPDEMLREEFADPVTAATWGHCSPDPEVRDEVIAGLVALHATKPGRVNETLWMMPHEIRRRVYAGLTAQQEQPTEPPGQEA